MKTVKVTCTVKPGHLMILPGNVKIWGGQTTDIPEQLLQNEGVKKYLKTGRLIVVNQGDLIVPQEDLFKEEAAVAAKAPVVAPVVEAAVVEPVVEAVEVVEMVEEGPDAVLMGALNEDGSFVPAEEVETTTEKPKKKKKGSEGQAE